MRGRSVRAQEYAIIAATVVFVLAMLVLRLMSEAPRSEREPGLTGAGGADAPPFTATVHPQLVPISAQPTATSRTGESLREVEAELGGGEWQGLPVGSPPPISLEAAPESGSAMSATADEVWRHDAVTGATPATASTTYLTMAELDVALATSPWPRRLWRTLKRIIRCESSMNREAVGAAGEVGLTQIHPVHRRLHERYDLTDPVQNLKAAWDVYRRQGWGAWACA